MAQSNIYEFEHNAYSTTTSGILLAVVNNVDYPIVLCPEILVYNMII